MVIAMVGFNLLYQFWIHIETVERMPRWFEAVSPWRIAFHEYRSIWQDVRAAPTPSGSGWATCSVDPAGRIADNPPMTTVRAVPAEVTFPLRQAVLRPHQTIEQLAQPEDDHPETGTFAAFDDAGAVVGTGTVSRQPPPWLPQSTDGWRIRGMAVDPRCRGQSVGAAVLEAMLGHVAAHGGGLAWCNARTPAQRFYERAGFTTVGEVFDIEHIGPHVTMRRWVPGARSAAGRSSAPPA